MVWRGRLWDSHRVQKSVGNSPLTARRLPIRRCRRSGRLRRGTSYSVACEHLSVVILTKDEEANLPWCLESVQGWDCWVVDSGSTDGTVGIAEEAGAHVRFHPWPG